jgi:hypothetical protein
MYVRAVELVAGRQLYNRQTTCLVPLNHDFDLHLHLLASRDMLRDTGAQDMANGGVLRHFEFEVRVLCTD